MIEQNGGKQENDILHRFCRWYYLFDKFDNEVVLIYISLYCLHDLEIYIHMLHSKRTTMKRK